MGGFQLGDELAHRPCVALTAQGEQHLLFTALILYYVNVSRETFLRVLQKTSICAKLRLSNQVCRLIQDDEEAEDGRKNRSASNL
jgi:hypothetical protein